MNIIRKCGSILAMLSVCVPGSAQMLKNWNAYYYDNPRNRPPYEVLPVSGRLRLPDGSVTDSRKIQIEKDVIDLDAACGKHGSAVLESVFESDSERTMQLGIGGAAFSVFVNGKKVYDFRQYGLGNDYSPVSADDHIFPIALHKGSNTVVVHTDRTNRNLDFVYGADRENPWRIAIADRSGHRPFRAALAHPELLLRPDMGSVMVSFITVDPVPAGIDYRKRGGREWIRTYDLAGDLILRENSRSHRIRLCDLEPGTEYEYRIVLLEPPSGRDGFRRPLWTDRIYREVFMPERCFRTFSPDNFRFAVIGDTQLSLSGSCKTAKQRAEFMKKFRELPLFKSADFIVHVGDMDSYAHDMEKSYFSDFFDQFAPRAGETVKPWVYVRGNHEPDGMAAEAWFDHFAMPGESGYYAFRHGSVFFLVLDCGDFGSRPLNGFNGPILDMAALMSRQKKWIERVRKSAEFKSAHFRIILAHTEPQYSDDAVSANVRRLTADLLKDRSAEGRIHLWIGGHIHEYRRAAEDSSDISAFRPLAHPAALGKAPVSWVTVDAPKEDSAKPDFSYLDVEVGKDELAVTAVDENGKKLESFSVDAAGKLHEIFRAETLRRFQTNP